MGGLVTHCGATVSRVHGRAPFGEVTTAFKESEVSVAVAELSGEGESAGLGEVSGVGEGGGS